MSNKKTTWLGLVAMLTIMPILVANPPPPPGTEAAYPMLAPTPSGTPNPHRNFLLGPPPGSRDTAQPSLSGVTASMAPSGLIDEVRARFQSTAPFLPIQTQSPVTRVILVGQTEQPKTDPPVQPPQQLASASAVPSFRQLPGVAPEGPSSAGTEKSVSGQTAGGSTGVGGLLADSHGAQSIEVQRRSPLVGDPRIEGLRFGQVVTHADGGYWFPARVDLDTVVSKLNSSDIKNILIVKGPFSVRYGPGFSFLDIESMPTPRSTIGCFDAHGSTSMSYRTNGQGWQGQQSFWGGNTDWGFRLSYDAQAAVDYTAGNGAKLPSGYNNQFVNFAYGINLSPTSSLEVKFLHVQQTNVLFPGLLTDINTLNTDAFTLRYTATDGICYDRFTFDAWVNSTAFTGDSANAETRRQIPQLDDIFPGAFRGFLKVRLDINTEGHALSYGAREITTWGSPDGFNISLGADVRVFNGNYNEFDAFNLSVLAGTGLPANLGIPSARQIDPGILLDSTIPIGEDWLFKVGTRVDFVTTQFLGFGPNVDVAAYNRFVGDPQGDRTFFLFSGFGSGEYKLSPQWTTSAGYGYAQRPPSLTELYAGGAFLGQIQNGLNSIYGNPSLRKEEMHQANIGLNAKYEKVRVGASAFGAFLPNYITYREAGKFIVTVPQVGVGITPINQLQFINTRSATLYGFDAYGEVDAAPRLTPFATLSYVQGWDQTRDQALPGIAPLTSRVGMRFHEAGENPRWGLEYYARMVATQDLFAGILGEQRTGGFVVHNVRAYWQARDNFLLLAGVENIGNLHYREHLDLRTGLSVFQPGVNFYAGLKITY